MAKIIETSKSDTSKITLCGPVKTGALPMGFWQSRNGQTILREGASTAGVSNSGAWLRQFSPFQDLSDTATGLQVGSYVTDIITAANTLDASMNAVLKAQMLATALAVYFSNPTLGGNKINAPITIGSVEVDLLQVCTNLSRATYKDVTSAFNVTPPPSTLPVLKMLINASKMSNIGGSTWYGNVKAAQELAKDAFDAINHEKVFAYALIYGSLGFRSENYNRSLIFIPAVVR